MPDDDYIIPGHTEAVDGVRYVGRVGGKARVSACKGHIRHWFAVWGFVGLRSPVCVRCGAANPRPLTADEMVEYEEVMASRRA